MSIDNKSFRIKANLGQDKHIQIPLEQQFETLDILSLKLKQEDVYRNFSSDYGCIIGRVSAKGIGIPNAKISIFIPLSDTDAANPFINAVYPHTTIEELNRDGKRYNLLPRVSTLDKFSGWFYNTFGIGFKPKTPLGSMKTKEELLCDDVFTEVYKKYYKYSTISNESGDFMLFGVPVGNHTLHMDCDLTDIGRFSLHPITLQKKMGIPPELFSNEGTKINKTKDLDSSPNLLSQNIAVNVIPFWGQGDQLQIGITRQDIEIKTELNPSFVVFGSNMTMARGSWWGDKVVFRVIFGFALLCVRLKIPSSDIRILGIRFRAGSIMNETIKFPIYIPFVNIETLFGNSDEQYCTVNGGKFTREPFDFRFQIFTDVCIFDVANQLEIIFQDDKNVGLDLDTHQIGKLQTKIFTIPEATESLLNVSPPDDDTKKTLLQNNIRLLSSSEYGEFLEDGAFIYIIYCDRDRRVTDEFGNLVPTNDPNTGVFTAFRGSFLCEMDAPLQSPNTRDENARVKMKVPQSFDYDNGNTYNNNPNNGDYFKWVKQACLFTGGTYTNTFNTPYFFAGELYSVAQLINTRNVLIDSSYTFDDESVNSIWDEDSGRIRETTAGDMARNGTNANPDVNQQDGIFGNDWLNFNLYFLHFMYKTKRHMGDSYHKYCAEIINKTRLKDNASPLGGIVTSTKFFNRGDIFQTDFIHVSKTDLLQLAIYSNKSGIRVSPFPVGDNYDLNITLTGNYRYDNSNTVFFYKGLGAGDCLAMLINKGII